MSGGKRNSCTAIRHVIPAWHRRSLKLKLRRFFDLLPYDVIDLVLF